MPGAQSRGADRGSSFPSSSLCYHYLAAGAGALEQGAGEMVAGGAGHVTAGAHHEGPGPGDRGEDFVLG